MQYFLMYLAINTIAYIIMHKTLKPHWMRKFREQNKKANMLPPKMEERIVVFFNVLLLPFVLFEDIIMSIVRNLRGKKNDTGTDSH